MAAQARVHHRHRTVVEIAHQDHWMVQIPRKENRVTEHAVPLKASFPRSESQMAVKHVEHGAGLHLKIGALAIAWLAPHSVAEVVIFRPQHLERAQYRHTERPFSGRPCSTERRGGAPTSRQLIYLIAQGGLLNFLQRRDERLPFVPLLFPNDALDAAEIAQPVPPDPGMDVVRKELQTSADSGAVHLSTSARLTSV